MCYVNDSVLTSQARKFKIIWPALPHFSLQMHYGIACKVYQLSSANVVSDSALHFQSIKCIPPFRIILSFYFRFTERTQKRKILFYLDSFLRIKNMVINFVSYTEKNYIPDFSEHMMICQYINVQRTQSVFLCCNAIKIDTLNYYLIPNGQSLLRAKSVFGDFTLEEKR